MQARTSVFLMMIMVCFSVLAVEPDLKMSQTAPISDPLNLTKDSGLHPAATNESWYISGFVENEQSDKFAYYFVVHRVNGQFSYFTQVLSMQTGQVIYKSTEQAELSLATRQGINFKIGDGFLRYNDINDSWTFGVDSKEGFNLRVESLPMHSQAISHLNNVSFYSLQSKRVNGQLSKKNKSEFVTASNAWVAHQWGEPKPQANIQVERLLCRFLDNQGVMMVRAHQGNDVVFSLADLLDNYGESHPVSQFSIITQTDKSHWNVKLVSPKKGFDVLTEKPFKVAQGNASTDYYLGVVQEANENAGSCMIIKENPIIVRADSAVPAKGADKYMAKLRQSASLMH